MHHQLEVRNLQFQYDQQPLLRDLNLSVPPASIYGFLGANGAGKSTTIRCLLGLLYPSKGEIYFFGHSLPTEQQAIFTRVGSLIESPSFYPHLTGYKNLQILCTYRDLPTSRIEEVLDLVNLLPHAHKRCKHYSTGMKQRLGLAQALLSDPDLLILDEPANGLDPVGIIEIRRILQRLQSQGKTIFLSSHHLSEIEKVATQVGILHQGQLLFEGSLQELQTKREQQLAINLKVNDPDQASQLLQATHADLTRINGHLLIPISNREEIPTLARQLTKAGLDIYEITPQRNDLEQLFIQLTSNQ
jgi:ABC-type multidrug transport system ATPase subunit